jgi:hemolysin activation/secretion protein
LDRVLPEPVPKQVDPVESMEAVTAKDLEELGLRIWAAPGEEVVLEELKGVRVVGSPEDVDPARVSEENPWVCEVGDPALREAILSVLAAHTGNPASLESLDRLAQAVRLVLAEAGPPFSIVYLPPQDITGGFLHLVVQESVLGELRVEGNVHFSDRSYRSRLPLRPGDPLDMTAIGDGLDRINLNPFRDAAARFAKGAEPGTADLVLQANDRRPWRLFAGYNNTGSETTSEDRVLAGVNWGNAFGRADQMSLQWTSDPGAEYSRAVSSNYTTDLPSGNSLTGFGAYSEIESKTTPDFDQAGESWQAGFNLDIPLSSLSQTFEHRLQFGVDFKSSDNNLDFIQPPFIIPVVDNRTHIVQARAQYRGTLKDDLGSTSFGVKLTASPGGLSSDNEDEAFEAARAGAEARYLYGNLDLFRDTRLPRGWNWTIQAEFQQANGNLLGSEQMSGGGMYSVRGYEEGEVIGDNGFLVRQELLLPPLRPLRGRGIPDMLQIFLFLDIAQLWNEDQLEGEGTTELYSIGAGFSYQLSRHLTAQFAYGWQLEDSGLSSSGKDHRAHFNLNLSF